MPGRSLSELRELVGESKVTAKHFRIEAGKAVEYARAIGDEKTASRLESAIADGEEREVPLPVTFVKTSSFPRYTPDDVNPVDFGFDVGFDRENVLHGEQAYECHRTLHVGDELTASTTVDDVYRRSGSEGTELFFVEFETRYEDRSGEPVVTERSTRIEATPAEGSGSGKEDGDDE